MDNKCTSYVWVTYICRVLWVLFQDSDASKPSLWFHKVQHRKSISSAWVEKPTMKSTIETILYRNLKIKLLHVQWTLTYPDTSVSKLTVRITEYTCIRINESLSLYIIIKGSQNICPDKWLHVQEKWGFTVYQYVSLTAFLD